MIVQLKQPDPEFPQISPNQPYLVIGIEADHYRLLDDHGRPHLYPPALFTVLDPTEPADWESNLGDDGERYAYPPALNAVGFFEDFFEGQPEAVQTFWLTINLTLTAA